jgi:hypothetical protein
MRALSGVIASGSGGLGAEKRWPESSPQWGIWVLAQRTALRNQ